MLRCECYNYIDLLLLLLLLLNQILFLCNEFRSYIANSIIGEMKFISKMIPRTNSL